MLFYWFVHHLKGDNGQDIGHTLISDFSLLFRLFSLLAVPVRFVSWSKERPSSTERARGTKWKQCSRSWCFLARTSTLKVRLLAFPFLCNHLVTVISLCSHCLLWGFEERLTLEKKKRRQEIRVCVCVNMCVRVSSLRLTFSENVKCVSRKSRMGLGGLYLNLYCDFLKWIECHLIFQSDFLFFPCRSNIMTYTIYMEMLCSFKGLSKFAIPFLS